MLNLMEMMVDEEDTMPAPCKHGNIVLGHACYCHHESPDAPRKCHIWRNGEDWNVKNCELFEALKEKNG